MKQDKNIEAIKSVVHSFFPKSKIILFGSRAKKMENEDSDYDLMVIIDKTFPLQEKINWRGKMHKALVKELEAPVDLLLNSEEEINIKKEFPGHIIQSVLEEGVLL